MRHVARLLLWGILLLTAGLPLAWLLGTLLLHPSAAAQLVPDVHRATVFLRTIALATAGATGATLLALLPAAALARGRWSGLVLWPAMAGLLVVPAAAWAYGWAEFLRQNIGLVFPQSWADLARVVLTNATGLWPVPAAAIALAWRRLPGDVLDAATLDGTRGRTSARLLLAPALAGWAGAFLLAGQNLAAADLTGIVTASVVIRDTFQLGGGDQGQRIALAVAAGLPSLVTMALAAIAGWAIFRRSTSAAGDAPSEIDLSMETSGGVPVRPSANRRGSVRELALLLPVLLLLVAVLLPPAVALLRTNNGLDVLAASGAHGPALVRGFALAAGATLICAIVALLGTLARPRIPLLISLGAFLLGGQFLALGMLRLAWLTLPALAWASTPLVIWADEPQYSAETAASNVFYVSAYVALFAWLPLAAAAVTWRGKWQALRDLAAADGANALQAAAYVLWPLAWPGLLAASLGVAALSLTESSATALLVPGTPINFMLSNLHTLNYPAMAEASLLMTLICTGTTAAVVAAWVGLGWSKAGDGQQPVVRKPARTALLLACPLCFLNAACDRPPAPEAIWTESGTGDGQLAYPRAITWSSADDTVWVVDKSARVQQFDSSGNFIRGFHTPESFYGKPAGISADAQGNVWLADTHYYRVIVYRHDGTEWFRFGEKGEGPGQFIWPTDVLVTADGLVIVSEYGGGAGEDPSNDRIQVFRPDPDGTITDPPRQLVAQIGRFGDGEGEFRRPQSMALLGETLWVADGVNHRLAAFDLSGNFLRAWGGAAGSAPGQFRFPYGLAVDREGMLLVSEFGNHRVQRIDPATGQCLGLWGGGFGARPGELKYPWGLAYDAARDRVLVLDSGNDRIQVIAASAIRMPGSKR